MCDDEPQHESLLDFGQLVDFSETRKAQKGSKFFVYLLMKEASIGSEERKGTEDSPQVGDLLCAREDADLVAPISCYFLFLHPIRTDLSVTLLAVLMLKLEVNGHQIDEVWQKIAFRLRCIKKDWVDIMLQDVHPSSYKYEEIVFIESCP